MDGGGGGVGVDSLSVSSVGSEAMQPINPIPSWMDSGLSVSSVGSEAMQPLTPCGVRGILSLFQYPRSDRRRCNNATTNPIAPPFPPLSVSSVGSEAMQPEDQRGLRAGKADLSVSSVGSEAMQPGLPGVAGPRVAVFQYPRSDRRRCNILPKMGCAPPWGEGFQYPRSDRRRCNVWTGAGAAWG